VPGIHLARHLRLRLRRHGNACATQDLGLLVHGEHGLAVTQ